MEVHQSRFPHHSQFSTDEISLQVVMEIHNIFGLWFFLVVWPDPTTPTPTTTPKPTPTLSEGQWIANNIVYTRLPHPCSEFYAACPMVCKRGHMTFANGTTCETCNCDGAISCKFKVNFYIIPWLVAFLMNRTFVSFKGLFRANSGQITDSYV